VPQSDALRQHAAFVSTAPWIDGVRYNFDIPMTMKSMQWLIVVVVCRGLMLVQPSVSLTWLLDPYRHAKIDTDLHGQTLDGRTLPDRADHPPLRA